MFWSQHLGCVWGQNTSRIQNKEVYATLYLQHGCPVAFGSLLIRVDVVEKDLFPPIRVQAVPVITKRQRAGSMRLGCHRAFVKWPITGPITMHCARPTARRARMVCPRHTCVNTLVRGSCFDGGERQPYAPLCEVVLLIRGGIPYK